MIELQRTVEADRKVRMRQVAEMGLLTRKLRVAALTDVLTDLPNRRYALTRLQQEWDAAARLGRPLSVVMVDLDHFKRVNDEHGHQVGDTLLAELGAFLRDRVRTRDQVARYGGEEFIVIAHAAHAVDPGSIANRFLGAWRERAPMATFSIGVARHEEAESPALTLQRADRALYRAKELGRDCWCADDERLAGAQSL